jgi:hypothetical protein
LTKETPHLKSPETPLRGGGEGVYVGIFAIFEGIDGRAKLPIVKF